MLRPSPWWQPDVFSARHPNLRARARIKRALCGHFVDEGFEEVDTPALQVSPGNETHVSAFATAATTPNGSRQPLFLHTSPEFACKKLLAAGVSRIFTLAPVFRDRERGRLHHPSFTMLEWYRAGAPPDVLIRDCAAVLRCAARAAGTTTFRHRGSVVDAHADPEVITMADAFRRHVGVDLVSLLPQERDGRARLGEVTANLGLRVAADDTWSDLFSKVLSAWIEPHLGLTRPTILTRYPASEAALARLCADDPRFAERFELYVCGVELANAFEELTDAAEQRRRFEAAEAERQRIYGTRHPIDDDFLDALAHIPAAAGIALGFDRLVMLATGAETIEDVLWAPVAEPAA